MTASISGPVSLTCRLSEEGELHMGRRGVIVYSLHYLHITAALCISGPRQK